LASDSLHSSAKKRQKYGFFKKHLQFLMCVFYLFSSKKPPSVPLLFRVNFIKNSMLKTDAILTQRKRS